MNGNPTQVLISYPIGSRDILRSVYECNGQFALEIQHCSTVVVRMSGEIMIQAKVVFGQDHLI